MKKTTVFLIDDDSDDQEIFAVAMQKHDPDIECVFANDGLQALEKLKEEHDFYPDYIFIDINMPGMNGDECLREIRKMNRFNDTPVYIYSTSANTINHADKKTLGIADYIVKPSRISELTQILSEIVKSKTLPMLICLIILSFIPSITQAQQEDTLPPIRELKKLPIEELMNIMVTSVSRTPENLTEVASAIQVVTSQDIRRSAAIRLPEALRLAPNLQVAQSGSYDWGISARGFNGAPIAGSSLANKLLVMIDGRSVYTPLYGGVHWDVQHTLMEDVERIEVVSGPGGTIWGANAVNGVINIVSKSSKETQGFYLSGAAGNYLNNYVAARFGSGFGKGNFFRVYGMRYDYDNTSFINGVEARDPWNLTQGGFRMDFTGSAKNQVTLQGDLYGGSANDTNSTSFNGLNSIVRWTHTISNTSDIVVQAFIDQTYRKIRTSGFIHSMITADLDIDHRFSLGERNKIIWGGAYRQMNDQTQGATTTFVPADKTLELISAFVQDQVTIIPRRLELTLGVKLLHSTYAGLDYHPTARIAWTPNSNHTLWSAVSQAVRVPSRFDTELLTPLLGGNPDFKSEKVISYELGYRVHPSQMVSFSLSSFYNQYSDLRSVETTNIQNTPLTFGNNLDATSYGFELAGRVIALTWWRLRGGYTYLSKDFTIKSPDVFPNTQLIEALDPNHQVFLQSIIDLPKGFQFDLTGRFIDRIPAYFESIPAVPSYFDINTRVGWEYRFITLSVTGYNLTAPSHREFGNKNIQRSFFGRLTIRL